MQSFEAEFNTEIMDSLQQVDFFLYSQQIRLIKHV